MPPGRLPVALTIAGSDSGGGAGIQADLKTFQALGVYGTSVLTAITAQNTTGVRAVHEVPPDVIAAQIDAVAEDLGVQGAKSGMLSSAAIIEAVSDRVRHWGLSRVLVVDPVMVAKSGDRLLREDAIHALRTHLLPLAAVVTPNIPEAEALAGMVVDGEAAVEEAARRIAGMGAAAVVVKGGHREGAPVDVLFDGQRFLRFPAERVQSRHTHGTGCTFSAAIAACLARGLAVPEAVGVAKAYLTEALRHAPGLGHGHGPVGHDWLLDRRTVTPVAPLTAG